MPSRQVYFTVMIDHLRPGHETYNSNLKKQTLIKTIMFDRFTIKESNITNLRAIKDGNGRKG